MKKGRRKHRASHTIAGEPRRKSEEFDGARAERDIKEEWLLKFGEVIFSIALGLSMDRFAKTGLLEVDGDRFAERLRVCGPLVVLYVAFFAYVILYW